MKHKKFYFFASAFIAAFLFYRYAPTALIETPHRNTTAIYDYSVKTEYGKMIKVNKVIDGDTVELINGDRLRYIGIDTPEEFDSRKPIQCFAKEAADENKALVEGKSIIFYKDISARDKYGRWLGYVYLEDGTFINQKLIQQGFAFAYPYKPDIDRADEFQQAESQARQAKSGLWAACAVYRTSTGREQTNAL